MFRCFEDDFHVFPRPWFGKSTNPPIVKTLGAVCYCSTPAAATKYCGHDQEKAAFFSFLGTLLSCQRPGFANAYFPFQIFKYSQILQPQRQSFSYFSQNTRSLINPFHLTVNCQQNIYIIARSTLGKNENIHNCHTFFKMAAPECIFDNCCYQRKA